MVCFWVCAGCVVLHIHEARVHQEAPPVGAQGLVDGGHLRAGHRGVPVGRLHRARRALAPAAAHRRGAARLRLQAPPGPALHRHRQRPRVSESELVLHGGGGGRGDARQAEARAGDSRHHDPRRRGIGHGTVPPPAAARGKLRWRLVVDARAADPAGRVPARRGEGGGPAHPAAVGPAVVRHRRGGGRAGALLGAVPAAGGSRGAPADGHRHGEGGQNLRRVPSDDRPRRRFPHWQVHRPRRVLAGHRPERPRRPLPRHRYLPQGTPGPEQGGQEAAVPLDRLPEAIAGRAGAGDIQRSDAVAHHCAVSLRRAGENNRRGRQPWRRATGPASVDVVAVSRLTAIDRDDEAAATDHKSDVQRPRRGGHEERVHGEAAAMTRSLSASTKTAARKDRTVEERGAG